MLIAFLNGLMSYLLVFIISVIGVGLAIFAGITWRKAKNKTAAASGASESSDNE